MNKIWLRAGTAAIAMVSGTIGTQAHAQESRDKDKDNYRDNAEEIVVTATTREQQVKDAPASISVVTREDLERLPYREITDALLEVPGVTVTTGEGNSRDISIRGVDPQYTLILVDGRRLSARESRTNGGNISEGGLLPPIEAIERIEIVRGPMSSLYGSDAIGGVINVITRRVTDDWSGSVRVDGTLQGDDAYGNIGNGSFYLSGPLTKDIGLQLLGGISRREEDEIIGGTPERRDESLEGKLGFDLGPNHGFLLNAAYFSQQAIQTAGKTVAASEAAPEGFQSFQTQRRYVYSINHTGDWGFADSESYVQIEDARELVRERQIINTVAQSIWSVPIASSFASLGAFYRNEDLTDLTGNRLPDTTRTGADRTNWAVFGEGELRILPSFALTGGLRLDNDEQYDSHLTPRLYAVWKPTSEVTVKGGYSEGFRAPNLRQTLADWGQVSRGGTVYGNPNLEAETSETYEASLLYDKGGFYASLTAYTTDFNDKITRVTCEAAGAWCVDEPLSSAGRPPTTYVNIDSARIQGVEASVDLRLSRTFSLAATGTLTDSEQLTGANAGAALNDTPESQASLSLKWRPSKQFSTFARAIYRGQEAVTEAQISGEEITAQSYAYVDVGASYEINRSFTLRGGIQNILDKQLDYEDYAYLIDPRRLWLGVTASF